MNRAILTWMALGVLMIGVPHTEAQTKAESKVDPKVEAKGEMAARMKGSKRAAASSNVIVNINTATAVEFEALPGIGKATANRIVEYRQKNGSFKKVEELMNVQGIGEKSFLKLRAQLTVSGKPDGGRTQQ